MAFKLKKETNKLPLRKKEANIFLFIKKQLIGIRKMQSILKQMKKRRLDLGLKQKDMMLRVGISRQQYQRLESKGNPRLKTIELLAKGMNSKLMLIPQEKLGDVMLALENNETQESKSLVSKSNQLQPKALADDPWRGLLEEDE